MQLIARAFTCALLAGSTMALGQSADAQTLRDKIRSHVMETRDARTGPMILMLRPIQRIGFAAICRARLSDRRRRFLCAWIPDVLLHARGWQLPSKTTDGYTLY